MPGTLIAPGAGTRVWIAAGVTDMRRGMDGLSALVQTALERDPFCGHVMFGTRIRMDGFRADRTTPWLGARLRAVAEDVSWFRL